MPVYHFVFILRIACIRIDKLFRQFGESRQSVIIMLIDVSEDNSSLGRYAEAFKEMRYEDLYILKSRISALFSIFISKCGKS